MNVAANQELVNDAAKLMMHRLVSRSIGRDSSIVERAMLVHAQTAQRYAGRPFVQEWAELLRLPSAVLRARLVSRDSGMVRLRLSSPFFLAAGIDFTDYKFRRRVRRAAKRVVERSLALRARSTA